MDMNVNTYHTDQKDLIRHCFEENADKSMTASEISEHLEFHGKKVGLATIYRQLENLENQGFIRKFVSEDSKKASWQFTGGNENCTKHYHLKCQKCGKIIHLDCGFIDELDSHILNDHGFIMDRAKTVFYGICGDCR